MGSRSVAVTLSVAVEITLIAVGDEGPVCGPESATHSCEPSGVTARSPGLKPTWMMVSAGL
jgi:hypothetical protein